jgi:hypothetical protein
VATESRIRAGADAATGYPRFGMIDLLKLLGGLLVGLFSSHAAREAELGLPVVTQRDLDGTVACQDQRSSIIAGRYATHIVCAGRRLPDENPVTSPAGVPVVAILVFVMPR